MKNQPHWRQELKSSQKREGNTASSRWIQFATISEDNEPRIRTVVFRGWLKENSMLIFTDSRSEKVKDIKINNQVEVLWFLPKSKSQFRFKGYANTVDEDIYYWKNLNDNSKSSWFWPNPGEQFNSEEYKGVHNKLLRPNNFLVYEISIHTVELLKLENPLHKRYLWKEDDGWIQKRINP